MTGGEITEVYSYDKKFIGKGYINPKSQILVRLLTRNKSDEINEQFFIDQITKCWRYRQQIGYIENCRLVFGEADSLPQLIIDKFNDYFVIQTMALGIDLWKPAIVNALNTIFKPLGIYDGLGYKTDHDPRQRATSIGPYTSREMCRALIREVFARRSRVRRITRPAPMFKCPTSLLPICPSGRPTSSPQVIKVLLGYF